MNRIDIYICTKSKCTAKRAQIKLWTADTEAGFYNGPDLLTAIRDLVAQKQLDDRVRVHEVTCMSGCPVGPIALQCGILGITSIFIEFPVLMGYGWVADKSNRMIKHSRWARWMDRLAGVFLIAAGVKLALERRS